MNSDGQLHCNAGGLCDNLKGTDHNRYPDRFDGKEEVKQQDVAKFGGKIVYNPDGSAFIIEDLEMSENEALTIPKQEGSIVDDGQAATSDDLPIPAISNAYYISKSSASFNSRCGATYAHNIQEQNDPETPVVHSYKVRTPWDNSKSEVISHNPLDTSKLSTLMSYSAVPVKPILMCFICKLSFACTESFVNHLSRAGHNIELKADEKVMLEAKNCSAIIQNVGKEKLPIVSFLEPLMTTSEKPHASESPPFSPGAISRHLDLSPKIWGTPNNITISNSSSKSKVPITTSASLTHPCGMTALPATPESPLGESVSPLVASATPEFRPSRAPSPSTSTPSPAVTATISSYPNLPTNANMLQGTTIGACPDHVNGRPTGVECSQCDLILNQSRLSGMGWNTARNSCKTLKCPKCNWHYKYQETLEIHMKEKHPESETTCIYCITSQQHPRLARGETYTCGYKPYRCEVCNYSTTTKGNLSIHMQSDKHLNNMQELQSGGGLGPSSSSANDKFSSGSPTTQSRSNQAPTSSSPSQVGALTSPQSPSQTLLSHQSNLHQQQRQNWRCDVCNYETSVARNLRIHMTSEKHTHNMLSLQQQNAAKSLQHHLSVSMGPSFPGVSPYITGGFDAKHLLQLKGLLATQTSGSNTEPAAAMADLAYNQALLTQLISGGQLPGLPPPDFPNFMNPAFNCATTTAGTLASNNQELQPDAIDLNPLHLFTCCVCGSFSCDQLDDISSHLSEERSRTRENEVSIVIAGNYLCQLCNYKTTLKANFQLHCKTDKHLQRLSHVNHIKEGGETNEWKLRCLSTLNPVELKCNACDFVTNSPHKIQVHVSNQDHQVSAALFSHLQSTERGKDLDYVSYRCVICSFDCSGKSSLMNHVRTIAHLQMEQVHQLKKRSQGDLAKCEIGDIFQINEATERCQTDQGEVLDARDQYDEENKDTVNSRCVIDSCNFNMDKYFDPNRPFKCEVCKESFTQKNILLVHYNSVNHLNRLKKSIALPRELIGCSLIEEQQSNAPDLSLSILKGAAALPTPASSASYDKVAPRGSALEALFGGRRDDDEAKPFKCNICKVAYSQESALDIHIRSSIHQTNASKLQDLILSGQIDLSKPLIEQPESHQRLGSPMHVFSSLLSPKSVNSPGSRHCSSSPNVQDRSPNRSRSPRSSPKAGLSAFMSSKMESSNSEEFPSSMISTLARTFLPGLVNASSVDEKNEDDKTPSPVLKKLLQNYSADFIKAFSEVHGRAEEEMEDFDRGRGTPSSDRSQSSRPSSTAPVSQTGNDFHETLQKAMIQAQFQQLNPLLIQMSQMNPLLAMNLTPPLLPPAMIKAAGSMGGLPDLQAALLAQMHQSTQHNLMGQLGVPNNFLPIGIDPKILAFMNASKSHADMSIELPKLNPLLPLPNSMPLVDGSNGSVSKASSLSDPNTLLMQQQPMQVEQGKRARTRITDEQLKILRSNFDINNSPSEEMLNLMAQQTVLPLKVIKHWFRNTLFKERQKNKDSPYNFNNPPSTKLNLEEYEKTGESKVTPINQEDQAAYIRESLTKREEYKTEQRGDVTSNRMTCPSPSHGRPSSSSNHSDDLNVNSSPTINKVPNSSTANNDSSFESSNLTLSKLLSSQIGQISPNKLLPNFPSFPNSASAATVPDYLNSLTSRMAPCPGTELTSPRAQSPQSIPSSTGKRANRTRFTDYQIKVLQEFFENNAYPKDDDLEYLSKLLGLSPRVIVVWFQNARQKARKIYENQPASDSCVHPASLNGQAATGSAPNSSPHGNEEGGGEQSRFTKKEGCNYQCKKCMLIFQRYYELIRHQKQHCYKEEDAKRSAQAQKAAAQAAAQFSGTSSNIFPAPMSEDSNSSTDHRSVTSPFPFSADFVNTRLGAQDEPGRREQHHPDVTSDAVNQMFVVNNSFFNYSPNSPFGLLQKQVLSQQAKPAVSISRKEENVIDTTDEIDSESLVSTPSSKRKLSEDGEFDDETCSGTPKRIRTSILPEQLDFLFQKYQLESNPSRKMLEKIAIEVNLRKRVVQVWFQNARARERRGILKPPVPNQSITIALSNNDSDDDHRPALPDSPFMASDQISSLIPNPAFDIQHSMRKYYEDTMKRFMNDINDANVKSGQVVVVSSPSDVVGQALDLSSNFDDSDQQEDFDPNRSCDTDSNHGGNSKRFRTQMSSIQVKMMKSIFENYKTPTMSECSNLGLEIGLQKRVVQVWFQNARAKEKRAKLQLQQATGQDADISPSPENCKLCNFKYGHGVAIQDHIFTKDHLCRLREAIGNGKYDPESPGQGVTQTTQGPDGQAIPSTDSPNESLQMLQMTTQVNNRELLDKISNHQNNPRMLMQV